MSLLNVVFRKQPVERPQGDATAIAVKQAAERNAEAAKKLDAAIDECVEALKKEERAYASFR